MSTKNKERTYARNRIFSRRGNPLISESDGQYLLKLMLVIIAGSLWLKFSTPLTLSSFTLYALPLGTIVGLIVIYKLEGAVLNRRIWYAILLVVTVISYFVPSGIVV